MEFLSRTGTRRGSAKWIAAPLAVTCALGCAVLSSLRAGAEPFLFSHRLHVQEERLECVNCHEDAAQSDEPGMPAPDTCLFCHDLIDEGRPPERRVANLFEGEELVRGVRPGELPDEVRFSHARHAGGELECGACHARVAAGDRVTASMRVDMARCMGCHREMSQPNECAACHEVIARDWAPPNHELQWRRAHGRVARAATSAPAESCALCHQESTCAACHAVEEPASHTNYFRRRGHAEQALLDRDTCAACHEPDSCDSCHRDARPMNHTGMWGGVRSMHCLGCHFPLTSERCVVCHVGTPSHLNATPMPAGHHPAMNCRQCHGVTQPLPHVDKGDNCNECHF